METEHIFKVARQDKSRLAAVVVVWCMLKIAPVVQVENLVKIHFGWFLV